MFVYIMQIKLWIKLNSLNFNKNIHFIMKLGIILVFAFKLCKLNNVLIEIKSLVFVFLNNALNQIKLYIVLVCFNV